MATFTTRPQARLQPMMAARSTSWVEPDETLVPDVRGNASPALRVDDKVRAILESCGRSFELVSHKP